MQKIDKLKIRHINWARAVNKEQLPLNKLWIEQQVKKERISSKWINFLEFVKQKLEFIYPDNWDIQLSLYSDGTTDYKRNFMGIEYVEYTENLLFCFEVIIKFPVITITNTAKMTHTIRDLYVKLPFLYCDEINNFVLRGILGKRGTYTGEEWNVGYSHSHLSSSTPKYSHFCLGDTEILNSMYDMIQNLDKINFESMLFQIDQYVRWESIEGTPYIEISSIGGTQAIEPLSITTTTSYINTIMQRRANESDRPELQWKINNQSVELIDNQNLEDFLRLSTNIRDYALAHQHSSVVVSKRANGTYVKYNSQANSRPTPNDSTLFRGTLYPVKIIEDSNTDIKTIYIHPEIKKSFKKKLENEANNAINNFNRKKRIDNFGYPKEGTR